MRTTVIACLTVAAFLLSGTAMADNRHKRGYDSHYDRGYSRYDRRHDNRYFGYSRGYGPVRYDNRYNHYRYYPRGGSYVSLSIGSRHHDHFSTGSFLGGLVLGGVLGSIHDSHSYRPAPAPVTSSVTVIRRSPVSTSSVGIQRRLLRDLEGRCYEISRDGYGSEVRTEIDPAACAF